MKQRIVIFTVALGTALGADTSQWSNLQSLKPGTKIGVILATKERMEGRFEHTSELGITFRGDREITLPPDRVVRVYQPARTNRAVRAVIGAGVGLAAGALVNATVGKRFTNEGGDITGIALGGGTAIGAGIGAASGGGYRTVYQRATPKPIK